MTGGRQPMASAWCQKTASMSSLTEGMEQPVTREYMHSGNPTLLYIPGSQRSLGIGLTAAFINGIQRKRCIIFMLPNYLKAKWLCSPLNGPIIHVTLVTSGGGPSSPKCPRTLPTDPSNRLQGPWGKDGGKGEENRSVSKSPRCFRGQGSHPHGGEGGGMPPPSEGSLWFAVWMVCEWEKSYFISHTKRQRKGGVHAPSNNAL